MKRNEGFARSFRPSLTSSFYIMRIIREISVLDQNDLQARTTRRLFEQEINVLPHSDDVIVFTTPYNFRLVAHFIFRFGREVWAADLTETNKPGTGASTSSKWRCKPNANAM
jgi:hypothetical protein